MDQAFLDITPKVEATKEKRSWTLSKLKIFVLQRTLSRKLKNNTQNIRKYLQIVYLIKDCIQYIYVYIYIMYIVFVFLDGNNNKKTHFKNNQII